MAKLNSDAVVRRWRYGDAVEIDIVVQDFPPISGFTMEPSAGPDRAEENPQAGYQLEGRYAVQNFADFTGSVEREYLNCGFSGGLKRDFLLEELMADATQVFDWGFRVSRFWSKSSARFAPEMVRGGGRMFIAIAADADFEFQEGIGMAIRKEMLRRRGR